LAPSNSRGTVANRDREDYPSVVLLYRDEAGVERTYPLHDGTVSIGRDEGADIAFPSDKSVSSIHAEIIRLGSQWLITDEGLSRNGTFVSGERIAGRRRLRNRDVIRLGRTTLVFYDSRERRAATTVIDAQSSLGTVTVMFTDLVGSTELMGRLGDDAADRLLREHFAALNEDVLVYDGLRIKSLGDGLMLVFQSALAALACAKSMQQRIANVNAQPEAEGLGLRIGLNVGEAISAEDDYFGTPVVVAKRLCDRARPGQVLLADVVRILAGSRDEFRFRPVGALPLKGIAEPTVAYELEWSAA
jgi:class 3 adenylate cyclase